MKNHSTMVKWLPFRSFQSRQLKKKKRKLIQSKKVFFKLDKQKKSQLFRKSDEELANLERVSDAFSL